MLTADAPAMEQCRTELAACSSACIIDDLNSARLASADVSGPRVLAFDFGGTLDLTRALWSSTA